MSSRLVSMLSGIHPSAPTAILILAIVAVATWIYTKLAAGTNLKEFYKIPGPRPLPIVGNALSLMVPNERFMKVITNMVHVSGAKSVMRLMLAHRPYVVLTKASSFETILSSNKHITKGPDYNFMHPWLGLGLLTSFGQKWHRRRKMLTPSFHFKILEDFLVIMNEQSRILTNKLEKLCTKGEMDIFPHITYAALDTICESAMGQNVNAQLQSDSDYVKSIFRASELIFIRMRSPWLWNPWIFALTAAGREFKECLRTLHRFTDKVIIERKAAKKREDLTKPEGEGKADDEDEDIGKKKRLAFLDMLLEATENGKELTHEAIREEVDTFMFEGHDTTAANMSFSLMLLAQHPEIQSKVQAEIDEVMGADKEAPFKSEDLAKMKYLESCIKESLRLFPSVPMMTRRLHEDAVIDNNSVPAGTVVVLFTHMLHRDPEQFPDPEKFDPERFADVSTVRQRHPYAYVPFSAGPRNCIGQKFAQMEEKVVIASILRRFSLTTPLKRENLELLPELILRPKGGIPITLSPRK